jgi:hypothetical protein
VSQASSKRDEVSEAYSSNFFSRSRLKSRGKLAKKLMRIETESSEKKSAAHSVQISRDFEAINQELKLLELPEIQSEASYWTDKEFENLSADLHKSHVSSQLDFEEEELIEAGRVMPYDFQTNRKAKRFFKEDLINLTRGAVSKDYFAQ